MTHYLCTAVLVVTGSGLLMAQGPAGQAPATPAPSTQAPATAPKTPPRATAPPSSTLSVHVTDKSGNGIEGVSVGVSGPVDRSGTTSADGSVAFRSMRSGTYRLRFEREGFVTLERELAARGGAEVSVALNPAPKPAPAPPPPEAPKVAPVEKPARAVEPRTLPIPDFVERNLIGSEPQKSTVIGCTDAGTARILQVKDPLTNQVRQDADQLLYVVAGSGIVRIREQDHKAAPGWFALIPRGTTHGIRRDGRNPVITISVLMGPACDPATPTTAAR